MESVDINHSFTAVNEDFLMHMTDYDMWMWYEDSMEVILSINLLEGPFD